MMNRRESLLAMLMAPFVSVPTTQPATDIGELLTQREIASSGRIVNLHPRQIGMMTPNQIRAMNGLPRIES
jgi:hypothetical protein